MTTRQHASMVPPHYRYRRGYMEEGKFKISWKHQWMSKNEMYRFVRQIEGRKIR